MHTEIEIFKSLRFLSQVSIILVLLFSCSERDHSLVGAREKGGKKGGLPEEKILMPALEETSFMVPNVNTGPSDRILVGDFQNVNARALIKFDFTFTNPESLFVISAELKLVVLSKSGEDIPMLIQAHRLTSDWDQADVTFTDATDSTMWMEPGGDYDQDPIGEVEFAGAAGDTLVLEIDRTDLIQSWADSTDDVENFGLILIAPDANSSVYKFSATSSSGALGKAVLDLVLAKLANPDSTDEARALTVEDAYIFEFDGNLPDEKLRVGYVPGFTTLFRFDFSPIPDSVTINLAQLILTVADSSRLDTNIGLAIFPVAGAWMGSKTEMEEERLDISGLLGGVEVISATEASDSLEIITTYIRDVIKGERENNGIAIQAFPEGRDISSVDFFTSSDSQSVRPRFRIVFTVPPKPPLP